MMIDKPRVKSLNPFYYWDFPIFNAKELFFKSTIGDKEIRIT